MSTAADKRHEMEAALLSVINVLQDSQKGFADIGELLKAESAKRYFLGESLERARFRGALEEELHRQGVHDIHEKGTVTGTIQRVWADLKARLGGGDRALFEAAERSEDEAKKAYADALKQDLPLPIRQLVAEQQAHILLSHDYVRSHRDALPR